MRLLILQTARELHKNCKRQSQKFSLRKEIEAKYNNAKENQVNLPLITLRDLKIT